MNDFEEFSALQLDRLVDGELSEAERRALLLAADREPDGWRRIALAFLESATLRRELAALFTPTSLTPPAANVRSSAAALRVVWLQAAVLLAGCTLAFGLGRWSRTQGQPMAADPLPIQRTFSTDRERDHLLADAGSETAPHQTLRLVFDNGPDGSPQVVDVPVVEGFAGDPLEFLHGPPVISPELQRALLRAGRRVHEQRELLEVQLSDGRRGVVPVSNVLVENAGLDVFQ